MKKYKKYKKLIFELASVMGIEISDNWDRDSLTYQVLLKTTDGRTRKTCYKYDGGTSPELEKRVINKTFYDLIGLTHELLSNSSLDKGELK